MTWLSHRGEEYANAFENPTVIRAAIDRAHVRGEGGMLGARERAALPPMTGGYRGGVSERQMAATIRLQREPFDAASEAAKLRHGRRDIGAVVTFTGVCRSDEGSAALAAMTLEHYPGMAEAEVARHVEAAERRWQLLGVTVIHRYGRLEQGG